VAEEIPECLLLTPALRVLSDAEMIRTPVADDVSADATEQAEAGEEAGAENVERAGAEDLKAVPIPFRHKQKPEPVQSAPEAVATEADTKEDLTANPGEDVLRALVAEIVREELQGAFGERLTRNVRKLVRREIHHALASREID